MVKLNEEEKKEIIESYKFSFVDEYNKWIEIIESVNKVIPEFKDSVNFEVGVVKPFTFKEFCDEFLNRLEDFFNSFDILTKESVYSIFETMILLKIAYSSKHPSSSIKKLLSF